MKSFQPADKSFLHRAMKQPLLPLSVVSSPSPRKNYLKVRLSIEEKHCFTSHQKRSQKEITLQKFKPHTYKPKLHLNEQRAW